MDKEKALILAVIEELVSGTAKKSINDILCSDTIDWLRFKESIAYHDLTPFVYSIFKDSLSFIPSELVEFFKNNHYCALTRCEQIWQQFLCILDNFEKASISLLPLKGVAFLEDIYKNRFVRPMTDIDLLVKEEDLQKAEEAFSNLGYRKELHGLKEEYWRKKQYHITFYPPSQSPKESLAKKNEEKAPFVELHWALDYNRGYQTILPGLWQRTKTINAQGRIIKLLSYEDTLFCLALHNRRLGKPLCLKNVYDGVLLLNKYGSTLDWDYLLATAIKQDLSATLFFYFSQINLISDATIPKRIWKDLGLSRWKKRMILRFITTFTFLPEKNRQVMNLFLKSHFLLYDNFWEPIKYIINMPQEQFAKFYGLEVYGKRTRRLYRNRLFYIPYKIIASKIRKIGKNGDTP